MHFAQVLRLNFDFKQRGCDNLMIIGDKLHL